jgi:hypothetical protein
MTTKMPVADRNFLNLNSLLPMTQSITPRPRRKLSLAMIIMKAKLLMNKKQTPKISLMITLNLSLRCLKVYKTARSSR